MLNSIITSFKQLLLKALLLVVRLYQLFISPILGPRCRFHPSCSEYCVDALTSHGILKGSLLTVYRLCRCHPGTPGGYDPVPEKTSSPHSVSKKSCHHG